MNPTARRHAPHHERIIIFFILAAAALLSFKYFPGLESTHYYAGFLMKAIHPELLSKDPIVGADISALRSPYKLTIYYQIAKLFGELWLDDRFVAVIYFLSVAVTFLAADRIAVALGACGLWERAIVLMFFLKDHRILGNSVNFAHHPDFHHSALAIPVGLWLMASVIRQNGLPVILALSALLTAISLQVAPYAIAMALIATAVTGSSKERATALGILAVGGVAAVYVFFYHINVQENERLALWNLLVYRWYTDMAIPFDPRFNGAATTFLGLGVLAGTFAIVFFRHAEKTVALTATRTIIIVAASALIIVGLFNQFAPDPLKYPQLLIFPISRQLQYPQILASIAAIVILLRRLDDKPGPAQALMTGGIMSILVIAGPGNVDLWAGLLGAALIMTAGSYALWLTRTGTAGGLLLNLAGNYRPIFGAALAAAMLVNFGQAAWKQFPDWRFLLKTGIHGASGNAVWVGVDKWVRANTPKDAVILPIRYHPNVAPDPKKKAVLLVSRNLASRGGRAVPFTMMLAHGLDLDYFNFALRQREVADAVASAWMEGDVPKLAPLIDELQPRPDYVIAPTPEVRRVLGPDFPFTRHAEVRDFTVLKRIDRSTP